MNKILTLAICLTFLLSCSGNVEQKAEKHLKLAEIALADNNFNEAKIQIDSIKSTYPKAFITRKKGIYLMQDVELKEQNYTLNYLDSIMAETESQINKVEKKFVLEKNKEYQNVGNYFAPQQTVERNLHRTFLRFQVDEQGKMTMTSIYCGKRNIHHTKVKITNNNGEFSETGNTVDAYETKNLGERIEMCDFDLGKDNGVIDFIYLNRNNKLKCTLIGNRNKTFSIAKSDLKALEMIYNFHKLLSTKEQIKKNIEEANLKIRFLNKKISERDSLESL